MVTMVNIMRYMYGRLRLGDSITGITRWLGQQSKPSRLLRRGFSQSSPEEGTNFPSRRDALCSYHESDILSLAMAACAVTLPLSVEVA